MLGTDNTKAKGFPTQKLVNIREVLFSINQNSIGEKRILGTFIVQSREATLILPNNFPRILLT